MNPELILKKLYAAARRDLPSDGVPYAFEKRIMSRLAGREVPDAWAAWGASLWRAVAPCFLVTLLVGVGAWAWSPPVDDLHEQLDAVLLADLDGGTDAP